MEPQSMRCPRCRGTFDPVKEEVCRLCGIRFLDWLEKRAAAQDPPAERPRRLPALPQPGPWAWAPAAFGLALAAWCWTLPTQGFPGSANVFVDRAAGIGFTAPPGWRLETGLPASWRFFPVARLSKGRATIDLETPQPGLPWGRVLENPAALVLDEHRGRRPGVGIPLEASAPGMTGRRLEFQADGPLGAVRGEAYFLSGARGPFRLTVLAPAGEFQAARADFASFLSSIRLARSAWPYRLAAVLIAAASLAAAAFLAAK